VSSDIVKDMPVINMKPAEKRGKYATIPSNAACTLRFKPCVAPRLLAVAAAVLGGPPPAEEGGFVPLMLCCFVTLGDALDASIG